MLNAKTIMKTLLLSLLILISAPALCGEWYPFTTDYEPIPDTSYFDELDVENQLWKYIKNEHNGNFEKRETYDYQYQVLGSQRYKINAFCNSPGTENIRHAYLVVVDGGSCFFEVEYNSATSLFRNLYVNGQA